MREIIVQAECIAQSDKKVSLAIQWILQQAIAARKRCSKWYEKSKVPSQAQAEFDRKNAAHKYFIEVLERTWIILEPCFVRLEVRKQTAKVVTASTLGNQFSGLVVENFEDEDLEDVEIDQYRPSEIAKDEGKKKGGKIFEFDVDNDAELPLIVLGYFKDLHQMEIFIMKTWALYMDPMSPVDLPTASLLTSIGIELMELAETELLREYPQYLDKSRAYNNMREILWESQTAKLASIPGVVVTSGFEIITDKCDETSMEKLSAARMEFEGLAFLPTYITLFKYKVYSDGIADISPWERTMRAEGLPDLLPDVMIPRDPKWPQRDVVLTQMLLDLRWRPVRTFPADGMTDRERKVLHFWPAEDAITRAMMKERNETDLGAWQVFACHIAVDIFELLGNTVAEPYTLLRKQAAATWNRLGYRHTRDSKGNQVVGSLGIHDQSSEYCRENDPREEARGLSFWIRDSVQRDSMVSFKSGFIDNYPGLWPETDEPHPHSSVIPAARAIQDSNSGSASKGATGNSETLPLEPSYGMIGGGADTKSDTESSPMIDDGLDSDCEEFSHYGLAGFKRIHTPAPIEGQPWKTKGSYRYPTVEDAEEEEGDTSNVEYDDSELDMDFTVNHTLLRPRRSNYKPPRVEDDDPYKQPAETAKNYVLPSPDPAYYYHSQPVHSGIQLLKLNLAFERISLEVLNSHGSFLAFSNVYNAVRQMKLLGEEWDFIKKAVEFYKDQIFVGKVLPSTPSEILQRYMVGLGFPLSTFSDARTSRKFPKSVKTNKGIF